MTNSSPALRAEWWTFLFHGKRGLTICNRHYENRSDGLYGFAPDRSFESFKHDTSMVEFLEKDARCSDDYVFLSPRGGGLPRSGGLIIDADGEPTCKGQEYLTFWMGDDRDGRKQGSWYMLDSSYTLQYTLFTGGDIAGDMHKFQMTDDDTALITAYHPISTDLSPIGGRRDGWILDGIFQEVDIASGRVLFKWRASDHVPVNMTYKVFAGCEATNSGPYGGCGDETSAFDYFHLNSVEKDASGNYLVSGRHTHTISYTGVTPGAIYWNLGGKVNDFRDLSGGNATGFSWQHHAHLDRLEAEFRAAYYDPQRMQAVSQGSLQVLEGGNVFVGWGHSAVFTEFVAEGTVLCDAHLGGSAYFQFGRVTFYRAFRGKWIGLPQEPPDAVLVGEPCTSAGMALRKSTVGK
ncbi:L-arabinitol 4-dehydrogenase [Pleurostoma richardsiae]|uniref:L-arabinitol 4-dehydrogenase n=1 Tax=Pleurostoma richardsiae TaxID=41990 RepID=A0AA38R251_9PEZI|nr:L-arabinitol 4-dehydrogenase [Pleurostoma richardsiae]